MSTRWRIPVLLLGALLLLVSVGILSAAAGDSTFPPPAFRSHAGRTANSPAIIVCLRQGENGYFDAQDTDIYRYAPDATNGYDASLRITSDNSRNFLIQYTVLPDLPADASVAEATLRLFVIYPQAPTFPMDIGLHRVRRMWTDVDASWNQATAGIPWGLPGCNDTTLDRYLGASDEETITEPGQWIEFDITSDVIDWLVEPSENHGHIARGQGEHTVQYNFASGEHQQSYHRPELCLTYYDATPTPTITNTPTHTATPTPSATPTETATVTPTPTRTTGDIHGVVWHDINGDGRHDHEEPPLPNAQIILRTEAGVLMMFYTTGGDGTYNLEQIVPGIYWLQEVDPPGFVSTTINNWMIPVFANTSIEIDFGDNYAPTPTPTSTGTPTATATPTLVPCRDYYEPDDESRDAKAISIDGVPQGRNIHQAGDVDYAKFAAYAGKTYVVRTSHLGGGVSNDTTLTLLAPDGMTILSENDDDPANPPASRIEWICPTSGSYFVLTAQYNPAIGGCDIAYDLSVEEINPTPAPTETRTATPTREPHVNMLPLILRH